MAIENVQRTNEDLSCIWCGTATARNHIVPRAILRTVEQVRGAQGLRWAAIPNRQVQDLRWNRVLCSPCDNLFSESEAAFIDNLYRPLLQGSSDPFVYGPWLERFAVSIAWKCLNHQLQRLILTDDQLAACTQALQTWQAFLRNESVERGNHQHHILLSEFIPESAYGEERSLVMRHAFDCHVYSDDDAVFVLTLFPGCILLSSIFPAEFVEWSGTLIGESGQLETQSVSGPTLCAVLNTLLRDGKNALSEISDRQWERILSEVLDGDHN